MKNHPYLDLAERLEIPSEALGQPLLTMLGERLLLVENMQELRAFSPSFIAVKTSCGVLHILGSELTIRAMGKESLTVAGKLKGLEWE